MRRPRRLRAAKPRLTVAQILEWADAHFARHGAWPRSYCDPIADGPFEYWRQVDSALRRGRFGLNKGASLARLLAAKRGVRSWSTAPRLTEQQILAWADAYQKRHGRWPTQESGPITAGENWRNVDMALRVGGRGLPGGTSLANLLGKHRGHRHNFNVPPLTTRLVLRWADAHRERTGTWPTARSGRGIDAPGETWIGVNLALERGKRGLRQTSLAELLRRRRGRPSKAHLPRLSVDAAAIP